MESLPCSTYRTSRWSAMAGRGGGRHRPSRSCSISSARPCDRGTIAAAPSRPAVTGYGGSFSFEFGQGLLMVQWVGANKRCLPTGLGRSGQSASNGLYTLSEHC